MKGNTLSDMEDNISSGYFRLRSDAHLISVRPEVYVIDECKTGIKKYQPGNFSPKIQDNRSDLEKGLDQLKAKFLKTDGTVDIERTNDYRLDNALNSLPHVVREEGISRHLAFITDEQGLIVPVYMSKRAETKQLSNGGVVPVIRGHYKVLNNKFIPTPDSSYSNRAL